MNKIPNDGKVVIVDDCYNEILPLINVLNKNAVPVLYYSGDTTFLPDTPLSGIRLFFLDLRFSINTDPKTIISNACKILETILGDKNGPYLLFIWSSTGDDLKEELELALNEKLYRPEFMLFLSKADYFSQKESNIFNRLEEIRAILTAENVDDIDLIMEKIIQKFIVDENEIEKEFIQDKIDKLQDELYKGLEKAGLLSLFILWENTVRTSAEKVINEIYLQIPETIPVDKKLSGMVFYLAKNRLEKQFEIVDSNKKIMASLSELNDLYSYFYWEAVSNIDVSQLAQLNIQKDTDLLPSSAKFNSWKMITQSYNKDAPGNIYIDTKKTFDFFELFNDDKGNACSLESDGRLQYIIVNVNGECETAQNKYPVIRIIPGIIIPCDVYKEYESKRILKKLEKAKDYLYTEFPPFEYDGNDCLLIFCTHQCTFVDKKELDSIEAIFRLHRKYYLQLRQYLASDLSKQGIDLYKN